MNAPSETTTQVACGQEPEPIGNPRMEAGTQYRDPSAPTPQRKRRVLIVDDESNVISAMKRLLRRENYELNTADSGVAALKLLEAEPVQLIVTDYRMPGMTGVELLHVVREKWPQTLRIILSGYSEVSTIIDAINEGEIYKFISKPWNDEELKLHIRRALEQHELEEENVRLNRKIAAQNQRLRELNTMLEQRVTDASKGLTTTQGLLEQIGVGVLTVDNAGLIVGANERANEIISSGKSELIGIPAEVALPDALYKLAFSPGITEGSATSGRIQLDGKDLQCRVSQLGEDGNSWGSVVALWEDI